MTSATDRHDLTDQHGQADRHEQTDLTDLTEEATGVAGPGQRMARLRRQGRFTDAARLARSGLPAPMTANLHLEAGLSLAAVSDDDAATAHLLLAGLDDTRAPAALAKLAGMSWVRHDHIRGQEYALAGLRIDPGDRGCRIQLRRNESAQAAADALGDTGGMLAHAAFHADPRGNAGDLALVDAVRRCFDLQFDRAAQPGSQPGSQPGPKRGGTFPRWWDVHVHQLFDEQRLAQVNAGDGLVVGGGGLFLPDTAPNGNSGWQWNITDQMLRRITVPLVVWAVGHNLFEGQSFDGDRFAGSLRALVQNSSFIGLRNSGSVERVRDLLPAELADRVRWQPCPTTVINQLATRVPHFRDLQEPADGTPAGDPGRHGPVLLNCAHDRHDRRFGQGYGRFLAAMRDWILAVRERADVRFVAHCVDDATFVTDLRREHGLTIPVIGLYDLAVEEIHETYRRAALVVGMRGHAGMIPFGCGTPIISLVSHPKLTYFLTDIDRPDWGIRVDEPDLAGRLLELTGHLLDGRAAVVGDIARIQERLFEVTLANLAGLPEPLRVAPRLVAGGENG